MHGIYLASGGVAYGQLFEFVCCVLLLAVRHGGNRPCKSEACRGRQRALNPSVVEYACRPGGCSDARQNGHKKQATSSALRTERELRTRVSGGLMALNTFGKKLLISPAFVKYPD